MIREWHQLSLSERIARQAGADDGKPLTGDALAVAQAGGSGACPMVQEFQKAFTRTFGPAYEQPKDGERLCKQHEVIRDHMLRHEWQTLAEIEDATGYPQASISAQLRHLRKKKFGAWDVQKRRRADAGLWEYRLRRGKNERH